MRYRFCNYCDTDYKSCKGVIDLIISAAEKAEFCNLLQRLTPEKRDEFYYMLKGAVFVLEVEQKKTERK